MGNCQVKPKEGGESLKDFLARKFHKIAKKRKIDDLVTIAIHTEDAAGADRPDDHTKDLELLDLEDETVSEDEGDLDADEKASPCRRPQRQNMEDKNNLPGDDFYVVPSSSKEMLDKYNEESDLIRNLQKQLQEVQCELANLQKDVADKGQKSVRESVQDDISSVRSSQLQNPGLPDDTNNEENLKSNNFSETSGQRRDGFLHAQGDVSDRRDTEAEPPFRVSVFEREEFSNTNKAKMCTFEEGDNESKSQQMPQKEGKSQQMSQNEGRKSRMLGMITEGLRTRSGSKPTRYKVSKANRQVLQNTKTLEVGKSAEDASKIAAKITSLQKRDPKLPRPDKGIVWPKTMSNLSKADKAYYVEQFLRSELFRQRCLRKYQGSMTWMNGLTPFQRWILDHEDSEKLEAVLHPIPKCQNNAQAKVICWRGNTPPPQPKIP